jgi:hypothetical protein
VKIFLPLPAFSSLFRSGGDSREARDFLLESFTGNRAGVDDAAISRSFHERAIGVACRFVRGR